MIKKCAYCKGTGKSPFSSLFRCPVCRGKGEVKVAEPIKKCPFCKGEGRLPLGTYCRVCGGKGFITHPEPSINCDRCNGSGQEPQSKFTLPGRIPCYKCKGLGFIPSLVAPEAPLIPKKPPARKPRPVIKKKKPWVPRKPPLKKPPIKKVIKPKVKRTPTYQPSSRQRRAPKVSLTDLSGIIPQIAEALKKKGYQTIEDIATASVVRLEEIEGLTLGKAAKLINEAREKLKKLGKQYLWE